MKPGLRLAKRFLRRLRIPVTDLGVLEGRGNGTRLGNLSRRRGMNFLSYGFEMLSDLRRILGAVSTVLP